MEQSDIASGTKNPKSFFIYASFIRNLGEFCLCGFKTVSGFNPFDIQNALRDDFRPPGLDSEISLGECNLRLLRIAILSHQVTGISCQENVIDFLFRNTRFYYFADISKIGQNITRGIFAGFFCLIDGIKKISPL